MDSNSDPLSLAARALGLSPVWLPLIIIVCNRVAKLIPDNATGMLGWLRFGLAIVGINVNNNTGVAPVLDTAGKLIERAEPAGNADMSQGVLELTKDAGALAQAEPAIKEVFQLGAKALESKDTTHEG